MTGLTSSGSVGGRRRILIIEDEPDLVRGLRAALEFEGFEVLSAGQGREGVRLLLTLPVSVIVVDAAALRLTTREHALLFDKVAPGVPIVVTVAAEASLESRVALELAGFRVVTRPVTVEDLVEKASL